jgi:hypothetical protein
MMRFKEHIQQRQHLAFWSLPRRKPELPPYVYITIKEGMTEDQFAAFKREWEKAMREPKTWYKPIILDAQCKVMIRSREEELAYSIRNLAA